MFKLDKARWTLQPAFLQCSKHVKIICIINNKITQESNLLDFVGGNDKTEVQNSKGFGLSSVLLNPEKMF